MIGRPTVAAVQAAVAVRFDVPVRIMTSASRERAFVVPRQVAMALALELTGQSSTQVGRRFGDRDHTTVLHARDRVAQLRARDSELDATIRRIEVGLWSSVAPLPRTEAQLAFLDGPLFDLAGATA